MAGHNLSGFDFLAQNIAHQSDEAFIELFNLGPQEKYVTLHSKSKHWLLLHHAAHEGRINLINFLIEKGSNINEVCLGASALTCALKNEKIDTAMALIKSGINLNFCSYYYPDIRHQSDVELALMKVGRPLLEENQVLQKYTMQEVAQEMIDRGAELNIVGAYAERAAIVMAMAHENWITFDMILKAPQFNINSFIDPNCSVALTYLGLKGHFEQFKKLIILGASPYIPSIYGETTIDKLRAVHGLDNQYELFINSHKDKTMLEGKIDKIIVNEDKGKWKI